MPTGIYEMMQGALAAGQQGAEQGKQRRLAQMMSQAMSGPADQRQGAVAQMAAVNPQAAFDAESHFGQMDDRARQDLGRAAAVFSTLPEAQKVAEYPRLAAQARAAGIPVPPDDQYKPEYAPHLANLARLGDMGGSQQANSVQSRFVGEDGQVYALMRDGSVSPLGVNADANMKILQGDGGYYGVNTRSLRAAPVQIGGGQPQQVARAPGEVPFSIDPSLPPEVQADIRANEPAYANAPDGASMNFGGGGGAPQGGQLRPAPPAVSPAEAARLQLAQRADSRAERADQRAAEAARQHAAVPGASTGGVNAQKLAQANAQKLAQFSSAERAIERLDKAAKSLQGNAFFDGGPIDQYAIKYTKQGQEMQQAGAALLPILTALTRVPGIGAQSDWEGRLQAMQMPSAEFSPEVNKAAVEALQGYMADLKAALQKSASAPAGYSVGQIIEHGGKKYRITGLSDPNDPDVEEVR